MEGINTGDTAWMLTATALVLFMTIGLGLFYAGLVRGKNALNTFMMCVAALGVSTISWALIGYSFAFGGDGDFIVNFDHALLKGQRRWGVTECEVVLVGRTGNQRHGGRTERGVQDHAHALGGRLQREVATTGRSRDDSTCGARNARPNTEPLPLLDLLAPVERFVNELVEPSRCNVGLVGRLVY